MHDRPRPRNARGKLVVAAIDDDRIGPTAHLRQLAILAFERISRLRDHLEVNLHALNRLLELPGNDLSDREPALERHPVRTRLAQYHERPLAAAGFLGKLFRKLAVGHKRQAATKRPGARHSTSTSPSPIASSETTHSTIPRARAELATRAGPPEKPGAHHRAGRKTASATT